MNFQARKYKKTLQRKFIESPKSPTFSLLNHPTFHLDSVTHSEPSQGKKKVEILQKPLPLPPNDVLRTLLSPRQNKVVVCETPRRKRERKKEFCSSTFLLLFPSYSALFPTPTAAAPQQSPRSLLTECRLHIYIFFM